MKKYADSREAISARNEINRTTYLWWFTNTLKIGFSKKLSVDDLPPLLPGFDSESCKRQFQSSCAHNAPKKSSSSNEHSHCEKWVTHLETAETKNKYGVPQLVWTILHCYGGSIAKAGFVKGLITALSFVGPVLLGYFVAYLEKGVTHKNVGEGIVLIVLLAVSSILSALLNTNYNVRTLVIKTNMQGALVKILFNRCLSLPIIARKELFLTDAQISNLVQVDVDQLCNSVKSIHDLWALPVQICVACTLLYINIKTGFVAGILVIIVMIPFNSVIARQIGIATNALMLAKDARVKVVAEALGCIVSMKMTGLEEAVLHASNAFRNKELWYLMQRKYLDAICVFLWATTPIIVPLATFMSTEYMNIELSAGDVITAIALLNMLVFPMNALPWVINGFMEARVSMRRIAKVLSSSDGTQLHVSNRFVRKTRYRVKFSASHELFAQESPGTGNGGQQQRSFSVSSGVSSRVKDDFGGGSGSGSGSGSGGGGGGGVSYVEEESSPSRAISSDSYGSGIIGSGGVGGGGGRKGSSLDLTIPATVWTWGTTVQLRSLLQQHMSFDYADGMAGGGSSRGGSTHVLAAALSAIAAGELNDSAEFEDNMDLAEFDLNSIAQEVRSSWLHKKDAGQGHGEAATQPVFDASSPAMPVTVSINEVRLRGGQLLGVVGPTGSGKSSVLLGILGEIRGHRQPTEEGLY
jgi:ABC-type multidrug transport system fused ATPase/permease subunit